MYVGENLKRSESGRRVGRVNIPCRQKHDCSPYLVWKMAAAAADTPICEPKWYTYVTDNRTSGEYNLKNYWWRTEKTRTVFYRPDRRRHTEDDFARKSETEKVWKSKKSKKKGESLTCGRRRETMSVFVCRGVHYKWSVGPQRRRRTVGRRAPPPAGGARVASRFRAASRMTSHRRGRARPRNRRDIYYSMARFHRRDVTAAGRRARRCGRTRDTRPRRVLYRPARGGPGRQAR